MIVENDDGTIVSIRNGTVKIDGRSDGPATGVYLDVSTAHVDAETGFGDVRVAEHEYGWIVFVPSEDVIETSPEWLRPILREAWRQDANLINFDADADEVAGWETFE